MSESSSYSTYIVIKNWYCQSFYFQPSSWVCSGITFLVLICISLVSDDIEHVFLFIDHQYMFFCKVSVEICSLFFNMLFVFLLNRVVRVLSVFWIKIVRYTIANIFSQSVIYHFINNVFQSTNVLNFDEVQINNFYGSLFVFF